MLPYELSGFRSGRNTADDICDLVTALENAMSTGDTAYTIFLDVCRAFDSFHHAPILRQLSACEVVGRINVFVAAFLHDRYSVVRGCGTISSLGKVTESVPQGSVLNPLLYNLATAVLPGAISFQSLLPVRISIYADNIALWCVGRSNRAQAIRASIEKCPTAVYSRLRKLSVLVLTEKMPSIHYRRSECFPSSCLPRFLGGKRVTWVKKHRYLTLVIDDWLTWHSAVAKVIAAERRVPSIL